MSRHVKKTWFADFETTALNERGEVRVYLWAAVCGDKVDSGESVEEFIEWLKKHDDIIFFHNLRFDFSYIHYFALTHDIPCDILEKKGVIYSVKIFGAELRDTMNFFPNMSLKEVGEAYNTKYQKTAIDIVVPYDHKATEEEKAYNVNDCRVIEEAYGVYMSTLFTVLTDAGARDSAGKITKKLTNAGIAFEAFKEMSSFREMCPKTTKTEFETFRPAYKGGYVYSAPRGIVRDVHMIDCNSMYPFIYANDLMPYGSPHICSGFADCERFPFYIVEVLARYELKDGYIPIIGGGVGRYGGIEYKSSSNGELEQLTLCNVDLDLIKRFYDIELTFVAGYGFEGKPRFFKHYADTFVTMKNRYKGAKRRVCKVLLNSPYGKTAMNGLTELKTYTVDKVYDEEKKAVREVIMGHITGFEIDPDAYQFIPMAIAITAGARRLLLTTAEKIGFDRVQYMDTDSIKFTGDIPPDLDIDPDRLGAWKDEGTATLFKTIAPKKYMTAIAEGDAYKLEATCAGFNKKALSAAVRHGEVVDLTEAKRCMKVFDKGLEMSCNQSLLAKGGRAIQSVIKSIK